MFLYKWTSGRANELFAHLYNIRYIISLPTCQLVHSSIYLLVYSSTYRFILLTNKFHSANGLAVLLHIKHVDACLSKVYVNHVASVGAEQPCEQPAHQLLCKR